MSLYCYYLVPLTRSEFKKVRARHNAVHQGYWGVVGQEHSFWSRGGGRNPGRFTKEEIDRFPRYLRRGGEYGHFKLERQKNTPTWNEPKNLKEKRLQTSSGIGLPISESGLRL